MLAEKEATFLMDSCLDAGKIFRPSCATVHLLVAQGILTAFELMLILMAILSFLLATALFSYKTPCECFTV